MTMKSVGTLSVGVLAYILTGIPAANASTIVQISQPNGTYTGETTLLTVPGPDSSTTSSLSDSNVTVAFSAPMEEFVGSWGFWGTPPAVETATPNVLSPAGPAYQSVTSLTLTFSQPLTIFGLEMEPDATTQGSFPITLTYYNAATLLGTLTNSLDGSTAALFAASSTTPITSAVLTVAGNVNLPAGTDPDIAQLRYELAPSSVPEPGTWLLFATGFGFIVMFRRFRHAQN